MGCSTYLGLGWRYQPLAPGHPTSICDIGVNRKNIPVKDVASSEVDLESCLYTANGKCEIHINFIFS